MSSITKAIILAGGFGTRMLPFTKCVPKELTPIGNVPALQFVIEECITSGITDICVVLGENKYSICEYLEKSTKKYSFNSKELEKAENVLNKAHFCYIKQGDLKGTAAALMYCRNFVADSPFCVIYPDEITLSGGTPVLKQLIDAYETTKCPILGVQAIKKEDCTKYGVISYTKNKGRYYEIGSIIEKPEYENIPSNLVSVGRFVLPKDIFHYISKISAVNNEFYLPSAINIMAKDVPVFAYEFDGKRYDIGNKLDYVKAVIDFAFTDNSISGGIKDYIAEIIDKNNINNGE